MASNNEVKIDSPDSKRAAEILKQRIIGTKDPAPSTRQQTTWVNWELLGQTLGQPFDTTKIPYSKLYQMRRDPMIGFGLHYIKTPLINAQWYIECEDAQVAAFIDNALRQIYGRLIQQYCLSLDFGFSAIVKRYELENPDWVYVDPQDPEGGTKRVWDEGNVDAIVWKDFVPLRPEKVDPKWTSQGEFDGLKYNGIGLGAFPFQQKDNANTVVDVEHALWIVNERDSEFGSIWGYPRIGYSYRYWWSYWFNWALGDRHFEKDADPSTVVYYPNEKAVDEETGETVDYRDVAISIGQDARSGSTIALPGDTITGFDDRPTTQREWEITFLENNSNFEAFNQRFEYLDVMKLRSIFIPEQAFLEGKGGTSSRNVTAELDDSFDESQAMLMGDFGNHITNFVIPTLVKANFPERKTTAKFKFKGFGSDDVAFTKQIIQLIGQAKPDELGVDIRESLKQIGVPLVSIEEQQRKAAELAAQAAGAVPPAVAPVPGGPSGVTATGFYIQSPEAIRLSSQLPDDIKPLINIEVVDEVPSDIAGSKATFDQENATIYLAHDISDTERISFIEQVNEFISSDQ